ncbi:hypothetical protein CBER1_05007 [Cercospora berteroae]|uniref:Uncharacterized protein n=1 Tax=Cercospora berteroae TaxID=357750 RepID=A0A2S6BQZ3_9PEZI|nr:hypothetical protein CBER1_05007 [Cercospora berteroae]
MTRTNAALTDSTSAELLSLLATGEQGLYDRCGQRYVLEQLIAWFQHILNDREVEKWAWVREISTAVRALKSESPIVDQTAQVIVVAIKNAPWSMEGREWIASVNAIAFSMKRVAKTIERDLAQAENDGIDITLYRDPADYTHELSDEGSDEPYEGNGKTHAPKKRSGGGKPGSKLNGAPRKWTRDEILHMLRTVRDNIDLTWDERVNEHNETYVVPPGVQQRGPRTKEGIRQRLDDMIRLTEKGLKGRIKAKIAQIEAGGNF